MEQHLFTMKSYLPLITIVLCITHVIFGSAKPLKDYYDLNDDDQHIEVVTLIFLKLNTILNDTSKITIRLEGFNKRFDELDGRVVKIAEDFNKFKADIATRVEKQETLGQNTLAISADIKKKTGEMENRLSTSTHDILDLRNNLTKIFRDTNYNITEKFNDKVAEINQMLTASSKDMENFKANISKTVEQHTASLRQRVNETLQQQEKQQNQIRILWEQGSMKSPTEWHVVLKRKDGSVDFNRNWTEYKNGFGDPAGEFFIGLERLHKMTTNSLKHELLIELGHADNHQTYAKYDNFVIGSESEKYMLKVVGEHSGDAEDALKHHVDEKFTTVDQDNDAARNENCAQSFEGPWWFYQCNPSSNLFGPYHTQHAGYRMRWGPSILNELRTVTVKIRQV